MGGQIKMASSSVATTSISTKALENPITGKPFTMDEVYTEKGSAKMVKQMITGAKTDDKTDLSYMNELVFINDYVFERWTTEIDRLKPNKRKNWKGMATGKGGNRLKIIYKDGLFMCGDKKCMPQNIFMSKILGEKLSTSFEDTITILSNINIEGESVSSKDVVMNANIYNHSGHHKGRVNHTIKIPSPASTK